MLTSLLTASYEYSSGYDTAAAGTLAAFMGAYSFLFLAICVLMIVANWKLFTKAGEPGWASIIPFYNSYVLFKIAFGNGWLFLLCLVPLVNAVINIMLIFKLSKAFGHGVGFGFGLLFLSPIFLLILAFGSSEYVGA